MISSTDFSNRRTSVQERKKALNLSIQGFFFRVELTGLEPVTS